MNLRSKIINTWSKAEKRWRLFRIQWESFNNGLVASNELSFGIEVKIPDLWIGAFWKQDGHGWLLWLCLIPCVPLRIHLKRSWGGRFV